MGYCSHHRQGVKANKPDVNCLDKTYLKGRHWRHGRPSELLLWQRRDTSRVVRHVRFNSYSRWCLWSSRLTISTLLSSLPTQRRHFIAIKKAVLLDPTVGNFLLVNERSKSPPNLGRLFNRFNFLPWNNFTSYGLMTSSFCLILRKKINGTIKSIFIIKIIKNYQIVALEFSGVKH